MRSSQLRHYEEVFLFNLNNELNYVGQRSTWTIPRKVRFRVLKVGAQQIRNKYYWQDLYLHPENFLFGDANDREPFMLKIRGSHVDSFGVLLGMDPIRTSLIGLLKIQGQSPYIYLDEVKTNGFCVWKFVSRK